MEPLSEFRIESAVSIALEDRFTIVSDNPFLDQQRYFFSVIGMKKRRRIREDAAEHKDGGLDLDSHRMALSIGVFMLTASLSASPALSSNPILPLKSWSPSERDEFISSCIASVNTKQWALIVNAAGGSVPADRQEALKTTLGLRSKRLCECSQHALEKRLEYMQLTELTNHPEISRDSINLCTGR